MPGIVGFIGTPGDVSADRHLAAMLSALEPGSEFQRDTYCANQAGLGRVTLGIFNSQPQPVWNREKTRCLVLEGELYEQERLQTALRERNFEPLPGDDAALLLSLYEAFGEDCALMLNGAFVAAIWDANKGQITLLNDRLGQYPLYYVSHNGRFAFASGVRALFADPQLPRQVDPHAIAQFLTFDHLLHDHTLLEYVRLMPQAVFLVADQQDVQIRPYFDFRFPEVYPLRSEQEYIDEFIPLMEQAVARQSRHDDAVGILLSGGMDSRFILPYLLKHSNQSPIQAFTWGREGCDDLQFAREVAQALGAQHHFFKLDPEWLRAKAFEAVRLTDGMGNLVNLHALATLDQETRYARLIHKGFMGDAMFGFALRHQFWASYDPPTLQRAHLQVHTDQGVISFDQQERRALFTTQFQKNIGDSVEQEYMQGMYQSGVTSPALQRIYFDYRQRVHRMTIKGVEVVRSQAMVRLPFCDRDLLDFALRLPPGLLQNRRIIHNAFIQRFPELAQIPTTPSGLPMTSCAREIRIRTGRLLRWHLIHRGLLKGPYSERRPYADYHGWFRTVLRDWVEGILLSEKSLSRGYYKPDALRNVVKEHMDGGNHAVRLGALLAIELWHQTYLD
jgi:asparagine synthase (glutamine-hydrolysing)